MSDTEFKAFKKIPRFNGHVTITEKVDGTNGLVHVSDDGEIRAGSRNRWITATDDNYGFAKWVAANKESLSDLAPGFHYGEWAGVGIQRGYVTDYRKFFLFDVSKPAPRCCQSVPVLYQGPWYEKVVTDYMALLKSQGTQAFEETSIAPEGLVIFHHNSNSYFKVLAENDHKPKGAV